MKFLYICEIIAYVKYITEREWNSRSFLLFIYFSSTLGVFVYPRCWHHLRSQPEPEKLAFSKLALCAEMKPYFN